MLPELIKLFNCVALKPGTTLLPAKEVNLKAASAGYIVHPDACTVDALTVIESQSANFNTTFYADWEQVATLEEAEMKLLQLLHYISTYGTDYEGPTFTMNDLPAEMRFAELTLIMPCTEKDLFDRIMNMLASGIALNSNTVALLIRQLILLEEESGFSVNPERISNREAKTLYYKEKKIYPDDPFELMRLFMYEARGNALIINDKTTASGIYMNIPCIADIMSGLTEVQIENLASIFYRYKKIFLTMRRAAINFPFQGSKKFVSRINRLRKLAPRLHKPFQAPVLQSILNTTHSSDEILSALRRENSVFKLIRLLNYLNTAQSNNSMKVYVIRNRKIWIQIGKKNILPDDERIASIRMMVQERICNLLKGKSVKADGSAKTVRFPEFLNLAAPVSEKMFVGAVPYGSTYNLMTNNYIGIYWRNEWGTRDFDLWIVDNNNERIGWAAAHKKDNIMFSGDMTNADPEATEIMYCRGEWPDATIRVCRYNGKENSRFRLFFGCDTLTELPSNYMVNPDSIRLSEDLVSVSRETTVGIICGNKVCFTELDLNNKLIPSDLCQEGYNVERALQMHFSTFSSLKEILLAAGFKEFSNDCGTEPDIDLATKLSKDTLIDLLSV